MNDRELIAENYFLNLLRKLRKIFPPEQKTGHSTSGRTRDDLFSSSAFYSFSTTQF